MADDPVVLLSGTLYGLKLQVVVNSYLRASIRETWVDPAASAQRDA